MAVFTAKLFYNIFCFGEFKKLRKLGHARVLHAAVAIVISLNQIVPVITENFRSARGANFSAIGCAR